MTTKPKKAHNPPLLPIKNDYIPLLSVVTKAHAALGRLDATLDQLPNPRLLERLFLTHEAVESSKIEGTQASLRDVFEFEADFIHDLYFYEANFFASRNTKDRTCEKLSNTFKSRRCLFGKWRHSRIRYEAGVK